MRCQMSLPTIKSYNGKHGYSICNVNDETCVMRPLKVDEYRAIKHKIDNYNNESSDNITKNMNAAQKIGLVFAEKYGDMKLLSLRCSKTVAEDFSEFCKKHQYFEKSFLLSFMLDPQLTILNEGK